MKGAAKVVIARTIDAVTNAVGPNRKLLAAVTGFLAVLLVPFTADFTAEQQLGIQTAVAALASFLVWYLTNAKWSLRILEPILGDLNDNNKIGE